MFLKCHYLFESNFSKKLLNQVYTSSNSYYIYFLHQNMSHKSKNILYINKIPSIATWDNNHQDILYNISCYINILNQNLLYTKDNRHQQVHHMQDILHHNKKIYFGRNLNTNLAVLLINQSNLFRHQELDNNYYYIYLLCNCDFPHLILNLISCIAHTIYSILIYLFQLYKQR